MKDLHTEAMCWLRYGKKMPIVCTEAGPWNADVLGVSDTQMIEVEIKKSKSDFRRDFTSKKDKHAKYGNASSTDLSVPNYLYFFVPPELEETGLKILEENNSKAGLVVLSETTYLAGRNCWVAKKPKLLRAGAPSRRLVAGALLRMSSQLCGAMLSQDRLVDLYEQQFKDLRRDLAYAAMRAAGALDMEDAPADLMLRAQELAFAVDGIKDLAQQPPEVQQKWQQAATKYLEAQYHTSQGWLDQTHRFK